MNLTLKEKPIAPAECYSVEWRGKEIGEVKRREYGCLGWHAALKLNPQSVATLIQGFGDTPAAAIANAVVRAKKDIAELTALLGDFERTMEDDAMNDINGGGPENVAQFDASVRCNRYQPVEPNPALSDPAVRAELLREIKP